MIFDEYITSETSVDLIKMFSVVNDLNAVIGVYESAANPKHEKTLNTLQYVSNYLHRCQNTIRFDQEKNRELSGENASLQKEVSELKAKLDQLQTNFNQLLESWNQTNQ